MSLSKYKSDKSLIYLSLMILTISLNNFQSWALERNLYQFKFLLSYIQIPWHFLTAPFFYAFLINYLDIAKKSNTLLRLFVSLFFLLCIAQVSFVLFFSGSGTEKELKYAYEKYTSFEEVISFASSFGIFGYSYYLLRKQKAIFNKILTYDNLKWIYNFFRLTVFAYALWIFALVIKFSMDFTGFLSSYYPLRIITTIIIFILGYQGLRYLRILKERKQLRENINIEKSEELLKSSPNKREKNNREFDPQFVNIDTFIKSEKKFLQPKYTLQNLSKDLAMGSSTLSSYINRNAQKSFVDYINEMRVEQAKTFLLDQQYAEYTIASIGLESGFNSKSAFYAVFKKHTGKTPLEFKNSYDKVEKINALEAKS